MDHPKLTEAKDRVLKAAEALYEHWGKPQQYEQILRLLHFTETLKWVQKEVESNHASIENRNDR